MKMTQAVCKAVASAGQLSVQLPGKDTPQLLPVARNLGAAVNDVVAVALNDDGSGMVLALLGTVAPGAPTPPLLPPDLPPESVVPSGTSTVTPTWSGAWLVSTGAWAWGSDPSQGVWGGNDHKGAAYFGRQLKALGTLTAGRLKLHRPSGNGSSSAATLTMTLLGGYGKPTSGGPTILTTAAGPSLAWNKSATWTVPGAWLTRLSAGGDAGGIGLGGSPFAKVSAAALQLTVDWEGN